MLSKVSPVRPGKISLSPGAKLTMVPENRPGLLMTMTPPRSSRLSPSAPLTWSAPFAARNDRATPASIVSGVASNTP